MVDCPVLKFSVLELNEMNPLGIDKGLFSQYNMKAEDKNGQIVGYIIVKEKPLFSRKPKGLSKNDLMEIEAICQNRWLNIRMIRIKEEYRFSGNVENMFDYLVDKVLPSDCYLWSNNYWDRKTNYLQQLGFYDFHSRLNFSPNIKIFSVYHYKNE